MNEAVRFPKPSFFHQACAVLSILGSSALIGTCLPGLIYWEACFTFSSLIMIPWPTILVIQQYRGTFRNNGSAAAWATVLTSFPLSIVALAGAGILFQDPNWKTVLIFAALMIGITTVQLSNWLWWRILSRTAAAGLIPPNNAQFSVRELLLGIAIVAVILAVGIPLTKPLEGHNVAPDATPLSLPEASSSVTYQYASYFTRYECTVDEEHFLQWFAANYPESDLKPISGEVSRYNFKTQRFESRVLKNGWRYAWREGDQAETITYDRDDQRLYYDANSR